MERNRVHPTHTTSAAALTVSSTGVYTQLRRNWRNPQLPARLAGAAAWFGATHTTMRILKQAAVQDIKNHKEASKKAREYAQSARQYGVQPTLTQLRFNVHVQERGWVLKPKSMQRCRRDAACKQLEETRTLEQLCAQRPPKTHSITTSAMNALTHTELSFRSPLRLRAQVSGERPDRDIKSHLSVYIKTTASA